LAPLRALVALLLASTLTGCIVLPVGHHHRHRHGYQTEAVVVVPAPRPAYGDEHRGPPPRRWR
jgi:hypothetical protein